MLVSDWSDESFLGQVMTSLEFRENEKARAACRAARHAKLAEPFIHSRTVSRVPNTSLVNIVQLRFSDFTARL